MKNMRLLFCNLFSKTKGNPWLSALLIGIVGCALWEKIISPFCSFLFMKILNLLSYFSINSTNSIYREISYGHHEFYSFEVFTILLAIFGSTYLYFAFRNIKIIHNKNYKKNFYLQYNQLKQINPENFSQENLDELQNLEIERNKYNRKVCEPSTFSIIFASFLNIIVFICAMYFTGKCLFINNTITTTLNNIEIVSPYITDTEYKTLKSNFYSMNSKEDYNYLVSSINNYATKNSLQLKK